MDSFPPRLSAVSAPPCLRASVVFFLSLALSSSAQAIILSSKAERNLKAPTGTLADSGWQWEGQWGEFLGTALSKRYFITAAHIGGTVGDDFVLGGKHFKTIATYNDPNSDLQMWRVDADLPSWAPMFKESTEAGRGMIAFGRGTQRGSEVTVNNQVKGWLWGADDLKESWGKNVLGGPASGSDDGGNSIAGARLYWTFNRTGTSHEGTLSSGDSGGGVFVKVGKVWKLVGVNHSAEAAFNYPNDDPPGEFKGALVDVGGLSSGGSIIDDTATDNPARAYATRISLRSGWIYDVVNGRIASSANPTVAEGVPEPACIAILFIPIALLRRKRG